MQEIFLRKDIQDRIHLQLIGEPAKHRWLAESDLGGGDGPKHDENGRSQTKDNGISLQEKNPNNEDGQPHDAGRKKCEMRDDTRIAQKRKF